MEDCIWCSFSIKKAIQLARKGYWNYARLILHDMRYFEHPVTSRCSSFCHVDDELYVKLERIAKEQGLDKFDIIFVEGKVVGSKSGYLIGR